MFGVSHIVPIGAAANTFPDGWKYGFTAGTYIGTGAATAAIINSGLTRVHFVFLQPGWRQQPAVGTTVLRGHGVWGWTSAAGTPGSFYPTCWRSRIVAAASSSIRGSAGAATVGWLALGELRVS